MATLADRIRAAREQWVTVGGKEFLVRRPTRLQLARFFAGEDVPWVEIVFLAVVDWRVQELDLVPGGGARIPPFDAEAFREFAADDDAMLLELSERVRAIIQSHNAKMEDVEKN